MKRKQQNLNGRKRRFADKTSTSDQYSQSKRKSDRDLKERFINVFEKDVIIYKNSQAEGITYSQLFILWP